MYKRQLYELYGCTMELGGDDQWSNIIGGVELVRRVKGKEVCGMTFTLLTTKEGKKMGKTEKGAVWLDPEKTSPYEFFQYWRNIDDGDVINCLKLLTFIPIEEIEGMEKQMEGAFINQAKEMCIRDSPRAYRLCQYRRFLHLADADPPGPAPSDAANGRNRLPYKTAV